MHGADPPSKPNLQSYFELGIKFFADGTATCQRKSPFYFNEDYTFNRCLVAAILDEYLRMPKETAGRLRCVDVHGGSGINGLIWKRLFTDQVEVIINGSSCQSPEMIARNAALNGLEIEAMHKDPCVLLHERGYNFIYLDCTNDASQYFDAAFRNIARNGFVVITTKDDSSLHGGTSDVAMRRYGGRIIRTCYSGELGIRLFLAALTKAAARYNKSVQVVGCFQFKSCFTVAVVSRKGPILANKALDRIRPLKHCMVCEERAFYPPSNGFPFDHKKILLNCNCGESAPSETSVELGPLWSGPIFSTPFVSNLLNKYAVLDPVLRVIVEESRCDSKEADGDGGKRLNTESRPCPPFYYNLHKHHPHISQPLKLPKVIDELRNCSYRASRTHFDPLAVRTNAPLSVLHEIMKKESMKNK